MKSCAFNAVTTPDEESGLSCLQSACIKGDIETVSAILNSSPDKLNSAIALTVKIGHNSSHFAGKSIMAALRRQHSANHRQISDLVVKATKDFESQSLLHLAARRGHADHLRRLLNAGEHVNLAWSAQSENSQTPLMLAARFNDEEAVEFLVERGASLEMTDGEDCTPFLHAVIGGKTRNMLRLIELGADVLKENYERFSAVHLAAENGHKDAISLLLEHGADANKGNFFEATPLMLAAQNGHLEAIQSLLKNEANVNAGDEENRLPLHYACEGDHTEVAKLLVQKGANFSARTSDDETVLHLATRLDLVSFLVEQGADIHVRDYNGKTPLHVAAEKGQTDTVEYLINQGVGINTSDECGFSPLFYAFQGGHAAAAKLLIDKGCDPQLQDADHSDEFCEADLLESAATEGHTDVLQLLFDRGFPVESVSSSGQTPLMAAAEAGQCATVALLLDRGANINGSDAARISSEEHRWCFYHDSSECECEDSEEDEDEYGKVRVDRCEVKTPLYCAIEAEQREAAKLLIKRGAVTLNSDDERNSLVQLSANHGLFDILELLGCKENLLNFDKMEDGETLLTLAAGRGDLDSVHFLLQKGVDVNARNISGDTALSCVLRCRTCSSVMGIVKLLIAFGADVDTKNDRHETPLQIAAQLNLDHVAEYLLELGCEPKVKDMFSCSPLHDAANNDNGKLVELLLQYGVNANMKKDDDGTTALHTAAYCNGTNAAKALLKHGFDVEVTDTAGETPLATAAKFGNRTMIECLLQQGGNVHAKNKFGKTPLFLAIENGHCEVHDLKLLLDHGSSVNVTDQYGRYPTHYLPGDATAELFELLSKYGACTNCSDENGETPLHFAAAVGNTAYAEWLLQHGSNVGALDIANRTPLHAAAYGGDAETVSMLIQHGANVHLADNFGWLPLHFTAAARCGVAVAEILFENGSDISGVDKKGRSALHLAARSGDEELVEFLIRHGSNVNAMDFSGRTVLGATMKRGLQAWYWDFLELYLENGGDKHTIDVITGRTTLHFAAASNSLSTLDRLLNEGLELEARDKNGNTPLHRAAARGSPEIIERLVDRGADLSALNNRGQTPLLVGIAADNSLQGLEIILERGSSVQVADKDGNTALHFAVRQGPRILVKRILRNGGDVNAVNVYGYTPLHQAAASFQSRGVLRALVKEEGNIHSRDKEGNTPLHMASARGFVENVDLLIEKGSSVHARNIQGRTCLHMAATSGDQETLKKLILHGGQVNAVDELGSTPLHLVLYSNGESSLVKTLLNHGSDPEAVDYKESTPLHVGCCSGMIEAVAVVIDNGR